jgi:hypothetical protein
MDNQKIEITDEQFAGYIRRVEELIESRRRNGTLLSTFDLIAGASLLFFFTGHNDKMPAKWVFAGVRDGLLPDGILEQSQRLDTRLQKTSQALDTFDSLVDEVNGIQAEAAILRNKIRRAVLDLNKEQRNSVVEQFSAKEIAK